jgi:ankyrin repeat protein
LLDLGLDVNDHGGRSRRSVLMAGARSGNPATVAVLLGAKARRDFTDDEGNTALHYAAFGGNRDVIRVLLRSGLSINRENKRGGSPLLMAMSREKWDAAAYFIDRGASLTTTAITPEKAAAQLILKNQPQLLRRYADAYPSLKELLQRDPEWIHYAARKSGRATIEYLAGIGARINRAGADGWTPLMSAADAGNAETVEALLAFKADPAARDRNNQTALMLATVRGQDKVVETLRNHGVTD